MKKLLSCFAASLLLVSFTGCGDDGDDGPSFKINEEGEIGETDTLKLDSWADLKFEQNENGVVTAETIAKVVPGFELYPFGDGFSGNASASEKRHNKYAVVVPIKIDGEKSNLKMKFNDKYELNEWYVLYKSWSGISDTKDDSITECAKYTLDINKELDDIYGKRIKDGIKSQSDQITSQIYTWEDGDYTVKNSINIMVSSGNGTIGMMLEYSRD